MQEHACQVEASKRVGSIGSRAEWRCAKPDASRCLAPRMLAGIIWPKEALNLTFGSGFLSSYASFVSNDGAESGFVTSNTSP